MHHFEVEMYIPRCHIHLKILFFSYSVINIILFLRKKYFKYNIIKLPFYPNSKGIACEESLVIFIDPAIVFLLLVI